MGHFYKRNKLDIFSYFSSLSIFSLLRQNFRSVTSVRII